MRLLRRKAMRTSTIFWLIAVACSFAYFYLFLQIQQNVSKQTLEFIPIYVADAPEERTTNISNDASVFDLKVLSQVLSRIADEDKWILLCYFDSGFSVLAQNLYLSSIQRLPIVNHLFVSLCKQDCHNLSSSGANCLGFLDSCDWKASRRFQDAAYRKALIFKAVVTMEILQLGYNILMMDVDIYLNKNPFHYFPQTEPPWDFCNYHEINDCHRSKRNYGFLAARSTRYSVTILQSIVSKLQISPTSTDQGVLNKKIKEYQKNPNISQHFKAEYFDCERFIDTKRFWNSIHRYFLDERNFTDYVIVHWTSTQIIEAKEMAMKETGQWMFDNPHGYYTNAAARYLYIPHVLPQMPASTNAGKCQKHPGEHCIAWEEQINDLKLAFLLANVTDRILILPKMYCWENGTGIHNCSVMHYISLRYLAKAFQFREAMFLWHPSVPMTVKQSVSPLVQIRSTFSDENSKVLQFIINITDVDSVKHSRSQGNASKSDSFVANNIMTVAKTLSTFHSYSVLQINFVSTVPNLFESELPAALQEKLASAFVPAHPKQGTIYVDRKEVPVT